MRAILIETDKRRIQEVDFQGTLEHAYELLNIQRGSRLVEEVDPRLPGGDLILVDEEGLLRFGTQQMGFFNFRGLRTPLAGRGLVVGVRDGEWGEPRASVQGIKGRVTFAIGTEPRPRKTGGRA